MTANLREVIVGLSYIVATYLFIDGLRKLSSPRTARQGNRLAAVGMFVALVATMVHLWGQPIGLILLALPLGAVFGVWSARKVAMTAMPQMVALFNGAGGATAALVSVAEYINIAHAGPVSVGDGVSSILGTAIGAISFTGSLVAFAKLQELMSSAPFQPRLMRGANILVVIAIASLSIPLAIGGGDVGRLWIIFALALVLGATGTLPIGGGDMPVVIAILNSLTGLATAITGLVLKNQMLIVAGMLVGASGTLLTLLMSKAMNRSIANVLFAGVGGAPAGGAKDGPTADPKTISVEDLAVSLAYARRVAIIPGYGLAVAQAQREVQTMANELLARGVDVVFAIHPVAGRMPGHMNVLLAEANVPYDRMIELEQANDGFPTTDVALVVGANDVVNPAAHEDPGSPIYGMPILDAEKAKLVVILKRGRSAGFAGIDNMLFYRDGSRMLYGDAKKSLTAVIEALKTA